MYACVWSSTDTFLRKNNPVLFNMCRFLENAKKWGRMKDIRTAGQEAKKKLRKKTDEGRYKKRREAGMKEEQKNRKGRKNR